MLTQLVGSPVLVSISMCRHGIRTRIRKGILHSRQMPFSKMKPDFTVASWNNGHGGAVIKRELTGGWITHLMRNLEDSFCPVRGYRFFVATQFQTPLSFSIYSNLPVQ